MNKDIASEQSGEIRQLEKDVRRGLEHIMLIMLFVCLALEVGLGIYFIKSDTLRQTVSEYFIHRVTIPCISNICLYLLVFFSNRTGKLNETAKNRVCTTAFIILAGELSIIHSYFIPIWMLSLFILMFAGIFHDAKFHKVQAALCLMFILVAGLSHIADYPDQAGFSIECIIVAEVVGAAVCYLAFRLERFSSSEFLINLEAAEGARRYKTGYEFDSLTGVFSRAHLEESAREIFENVLSTSHSAVAMIDVDNFKKVNDTYGHENGDAVLRKLGEYLVRYNTRVSISGRYGGEEFVIIFRNADRTENTEELEWLRKIFEETEFPFVERPITISIGYHFAAAAESWETALKIADDALYESKRTGKNKITVK